MLRFDRRRGSSSIKELDAASKSSRMLLVSSLTRPSDAWRVLLVQLILSIRLLTFCSSPETSHSMCADHSNRSSWAWLWVGTWKIRGWLCPFHSMLYKIFNLFFEIYRCFDSSACFLIKAWKAPRPSFWRDKDLMVDSTDVSRTASSIFTQTAVLSLLKIAPLCNRRDSNSEIKLPLYP